MQSPLGPKLMHNASLFPDPSLFPLSYNNAIDIIRSLSDTVSRQNNDIFHARQDAAQARLSLNQSIQDYVGQHGEHLARQSTLNNQIQDCYDNIVAFLNLSAGYRDNVDALLEEMEESVRKWTFYRPDMPMEKLATAEEQIKWLREQSAVPILPKLADATDNTDHVPNKVMDETTGSAAQDDEWPSLQQVYGSHSVRRD